MKESPGHDSTLRLLAVFLLGVSAGVVLALWYIELST